MAEEGEGDHAEPEHALLFPSFAVTIGLVAFWAITRYAKFLPYTAVLFAIGVLMGIGTVLNEGWDDVLNVTIRQWVDIDSRVLLLVFLPGLIYKDAFGQQVHIFSIAAGQCLIFAFPMVLAGTTLTALIARYVFPYGWSFNLAMTFGAILSATDPVAVAALLEQVGAPPRLKVHIAGEALLNDGAAIVFFEIFAERYLAELGVEGLGHDFGWREGVVFFLQKSLGAVAVGLLFGALLLFALYCLNRKFNREENVVQVSATVAIAYIGYYTSGVLATVCVGLLVKFFGRPIMKDAKLLDDFWILVEHLLNSVLFILGGTVWGAVITKGEQEHYFVARDWGYLLLLYLLLLTIRLCLFVTVYPITKRIGLKTNWRETVFQVYGGLRGAVGIALAIFLDSEVREAMGDESDSIYVEQTRKLFGFVGGIAFMTLFINGITAGPLLKKLHLADSTETREKIVRAYHTRFTTNFVDNMVRLLAQPRFKSVNFALVKHHVSQLENLSRSQLLEAVDKHKDTTRPEDYSPPFLDRIIPYLPNEDETRGDVRLSIAEADANGDKITEFNPELYARKLQHVLRTKTRLRRRSQSTMRAMMGGGGVDPLSLQEFRSLFVSILRSAYENQIRDGELDDHEFLTIALEASLDFADDAVSRGEPLSDWEYLSLLDNRKESVITMHPKLCLLRCVESILGRRGNDKGGRIAFQKLRIERSLAFMAAHRWAQQFMQSEFSSEDFSLSEAGKTIFRESKAQFHKAEAVLGEYSTAEVENVVSHKFCLILLEGGVRYITKLRDDGLLKEQEAEHIVEELEEQIQSLLSCDAQNHPGEFSAEEESQSLREYRPEGPIVEASNAEEVEASDV